MTMPRRVMLVAMGAMLLSGSVAIPAAAQQQNALEMQRRAMLERRLRERMGKMVRERLELTNEQWQKLSTSNQRYEESRRVMVEQERDIRLGLRDEMLAGPKANQPRVSELLDRWQKLQRERQELVDGEQ